MNQTKLHTDRNVRPLLLAQLGILAMVSTGCAMMRKDIAALPQLPAEQIRMAEDLKLARDGWPEAQWWRRYRDPQLDALMAQALKDAPMMAVARQRVEASRSYASWVDASSGLLVGLTGSVDRQEVSANGYLGPFYHNAPAAGFTGPWYTEGTVGLQAGYDFDFWGKDKARVEAALGLRLARQAEAAQAELVLTSRVAQMYFGTQALYATLDLLEQTRSIEAELVQGHQARADRGLEARTATELARARALELDQQISTAQGRLAMLREAIRALVGAGPDHLSAIHPVPLSTQAGQMPSTLGYELLARRPDLQAMRWYVQASMSQIQAARAAFYPSFDIRAFYGFDALHTNTLLSQPSRQINLVPGLSLPIFDSGRLNAQLASARTQSNTLIAQYNQAVVDSVRQVAQSGIELEDLDRELATQDAKLKSVAFARDSAAAHYGRGLVDRLAVLEAGLPVLAQEGWRVQLRNQQIHAEIGLTLALGGGYRTTVDRPGPAPDPHAAAAPRAQTSSQSIRIGTAYRPSPKPTQASPS
jgi:multidrug efflux system outer membrane protein